MTKRTCRNPLSLDMGWKSSSNTTLPDTLFSRNLLSLDMGWKSSKWKRNGTKRVAIRFRWIWVGRVSFLELLPRQMESQSAFAGYGLEEVGSCTHLPAMLLICRNPLSLDMGWKSLTQDLRSRVETTSQSAFAGYGLEERLQGYTIYFDHMSQSAFAGYGLEELKIMVLDEMFFKWVAIRFRWIWVGRGVATSTTEVMVMVAIRFRWIWVGRALV